MGILDISTTINLQSLLTSLLSFSSSSTKKKNKHEHEQQNREKTESFEQLIDIPFIKNPEKPFPAIFIRAPMIHTILEKGEEIDNSKLKIIAQLPQDSLSRTPAQADGGLGPDSHVVAVKFNHLFATSFHPELSPDTRLHQFWVNECVLKSL
jgi:5'-phosphate synthase pdxT subunit